MQDITLKIRKLELPDGLHGAVGKDRDAFYIFINQNDTEEQQAAAFLHECAHIYAGDLERPAGTSADKIEAETRDRLKRLLAIASEM